jgi:outer membrane protein OmpA-like peptidoglycan-associated protein
MRTATMTQTGSRLASQAPRRRWTGARPGDDPGRMRGRFDVTRPLGSHLDEGNFGNPTMTNIMLHNGELSYAEVLGERFAERVPTTINFAFNSAELDEQARAILREQAAFIRHFPEVRFTVYGHTDLVGSDAYNHRLGLRRARAAMNYIISQGVDRRACRRWCRAAKATRSWPPRWKNAATAAP